MGIGFVKTSGERVTSLACSDSSLCEGTVARIMCKEMSCGFHFPEESLYLGQHLLHVFPLLGHGYNVITYGVDHLQKRPKPRTGHFSHILRIIFC